MIFKFDPNKATSFEPLPWGEYEVMISDTEVRTSDKGTKYISMAMTIRDDVPEQRPYAGRRVFHRLSFTEKTEGIVHGFHKALGTPPGMEFKSLEEMAKYFLGKTLRVKVGQREYNGKTVNEVTSVKESQYPMENQPITGTDSPFGESPININDDDLPF